MFPAHEEERYLAGMHLYFCVGQSLKEASQEVGINETVLFRATSGWANGSNGAVGRRVFLKWLKGLRSADGAPCCGARVIEGDRPVAILGEWRERQEELLKLERALQETQERILVIKSQLRRSLPSVVNGRDGPTEDGSDMEQTQTDLPLQPPIQLKKS